MLINLAQVKRGHQHFLAQHERMVTRGLDLAGRHAVDHVKQHPGFTPRTGKLQRETKASRIIRTRGGHLIRLTNRLPYAPAIDTGARPHVIVPKRRKFLRFIGRGGRVVFARAVKHPGNKPYKFGYRATQSGYRVLGEYLRREMSDVARRF